MDEQLVMLDANRGDSPADLYVLLHLKGIASVQSGVVGNPSTSISEILGRATLLLL